jgi:hypothetical protein
MLWECGIREKNMERDKEGFPEFEPHEYFFQECSCHGEALTIEPVYRDHDFYFSYWKQGFGDFHNLSFKQRLRWCWQLLTKGAPYTDFVIVNADDALKMSRYILDHYEEMSKLWLKKTAEWKKESEKRKKKIE